MKVPPSAASDWIDHEIEEAEQWLKHFYERGSYPKSIVVSWEARLNVLREVKEILGL